MTLFRHSAKWIGVAIIILLSALAHAEIAVVVSAKSEAPRLSQNQVIDIFMGRRNRLPNDERVKPIDQAEGENVRDEFYIKLVDKSPSQIKAHWSKLIFTEEAARRRNCLIVRRSSEL